MNDLLITIQAIPEREASVSRENMDMENDKDLDLIFDEFDFVEEGEQVAIRLDASVEGVPEDLEHENLQTPDLEGSDDSEEPVAGEKGNPNTVEVICPMCGNTFRINR